MAKEFSRLDESLREFIDSQAMFFVATAPSEGGRINLSPKGYRDTFAVLDEHTVAYLDLFGSGAETIAHLRDNGRITLMFCSFTRNSRILRLFGTGRAVRPDDAEFPGLLAHFGGQHAGIRAASSSMSSGSPTPADTRCPYYELVDERPVLDTYHAKATTTDTCAPCSAISTASTACLRWTHDHPLPSSIDRAAARPNTPRWRA